MTLRKKINKTLRFAGNELSQAFSAAKGAMPILYPLPAQLNKENFQKAEGRLIIPSHQLNGLFDELETVLASDKGALPLHLVVDLSNELDFSPETLVKIFSQETNAKLHLLFRAKIEDEKAWDKTEAFFIQVLNQLNPLMPKCRLTFEINGGNFLFADDIRGFMLKHQVANVCYLPHALYFKPKADAIPVKELFHVRMFFDALTRDKIYNFSWRNFYREFAAQNISLENSGWKFLSLNEPGLIKPSWFPSQMSSPGAFYLHSQIIENGFNPGIGFSKISEIAIQQLKSRLFASSVPFSFEPVNDSQAHSGLGLNVKSWNKVLITGWYGTETQGDKAILGEVLHFIKSASPNCKIVLTTLHQTISEQTNLELDDLKGVELVDLEKSFDPELISKMDAVIVGGGPLMESASMKYIGYIFAEAYKQRISRVIFGCGIGPIHSPEVEKITRFMLSVCNAGFVRDEESYQFAGRLFPNHSLKFACDPAVGFVSRWRKKNNLNYSAYGNSSIATLLRANTNEFSPDSNPETLRQANEALALKAAEALFQISQKTHAKLSLLHMNAPWVGGDDRIYNRILSSQFPDNINYFLVREYLTLEEHMVLLSECKGGLAMRYHGHIFCLAMGIPFVSLDYTGKAGKVSSLVNRIGYANWSVQWNDIQPDKLSDDFLQLMQEGETWSQFLVNEADKLVKLLHQTYMEVFHYCPEN